MARNGVKTGGRNWKPGESGNPNGTIVPQDVKDIRATQPYEVAKIINKLMWMNKEQTKNVLDDPSTPNIELMVGRCIVKGINEGCVSRFNALTERWLGKVKEVIMFVPAGGDAQDENLSSSNQLSGPELLELMRRAQPKCQSRPTRKSTTKPAKS